MRQLFVTVVGFTLASVALAAVAVKQESVPLKPPRPQIDTVTFATARCRADGLYVIRIRHVTTAANSGIATEFEFDIAEPEAVKTALPMPIAFGAGAQPKLRSSAPGDAKKITAITFTLTSGALLPQGRISGSTSFVLEGFAAGMALIHEFADVPIGPANGLACGA